MVDILYCAHGRPEFTLASLKALKQHTPSTAELWLYTDGDQREIDWFRVNYQARWMFKYLLNTIRHGGPVACMNHLLSTTSSEVIAKIDNDTIVPPGWLDTCLDVMRRFPGVDLLGIEPWTPDVKLFPVWVEPAAGKDPLGIDCPVVGTIPRIVSHIGGIGLFRRSAFERYGLPQPMRNITDPCVNCGHTRAHHIHPRSKGWASGTVVSIGHCFCECEQFTEGVLRYGFTEWQWAHSEMVKAFIDPPLPMFLLDHLPFEPWLGFSAKYEAAGIQRPHGWLYDAAKHKGLWGWWLEQKAGRI